MFITRLDNALPVTQREHPHCIVKTNSVHGNLTQILKQSNGNFLNTDYELIHNINL